MKGKNFDILESENLEFDLDFNEIAQKISQILPFSSIIIICNQNDFFKFADDFCSLLRGFGLKVTTLVYNQNITFQVEDLVKEYSFEKRGVIFFCKNALKAFLNSDVCIEQVFFIQTNCDTYHLFFNLSNKTKSVHYFLSSRFFDVNTLKKSLAVKTMHLIDYAFRNTLFGYRVDTLFFSCVKRKLVNALLCLESEQQNINALFHFDIELDYLFYESDYNLCSANVCAFLMNKDFFNLDIAYSFSELIIKFCKDFLSGKIKNENLNYSERASLICLYLKKDKYKVLTDLNKQVQKIKSTNLNGVKEQLKKLILIYQKFSKKTQNEQTKSLTYKKNENIIAILSGDTEFSINCMTAFRENITF